MNKHMPFLNKELAEYLEAHGYLRTPDAVATYIRGEESILIKFDSVTFLTYDAGDDECGGRWVVQSTFTSTAMLELFGWMLLLHVMGVATLQALAKGAVIGGAVVRPADLVAPLFKHHRAQDNFDSVPINY